MWLAFIYSFAFFSFVISTGNIIFPEHSRNACASEEECVSFADCAPAMKLWTFNKTIPHEICYFKDKVQYICCPAKKSEPQIACCIPKYTKSNGSFEAHMKYLELRQTFPNGTFSDRMCLIQNRYLDEAIIGGIDAVDWEFMYMAALRWGEYKGPSSYQCGGVLISSKFVLTAAHCTDINGEPPIYVRVGGEKLNLEPKNDIKIKNITVHTGYDPNTNANDIALIELDHGILLATGCIWPSAGILPPSDTVMAIGYGHKEFAGSISSVLQKVNLTLYSNENCKKQVKYDIRPTQICAGDWIGEKDTCSGDSGGPIFMKLQKAEKVLSYVIGITSFGGSCADGVPAVYTRVSEYREWIETIVWPKELLEYTIKNEFKN